MAPETPHSPFDRQVSAAHVKAVVAAVDDMLAAGTRDILATTANRASDALDAPRPVQSDPVLEEFYTNARPLRQVEIDYLIKQNKVPVMALAEDGDGRGWHLATARVVFYNGIRFDFADDGDEAAVPAIVNVARDRDGYPLDIVAWSPRSGMLGSLFNRAPLVGEHELDEPRFDCSLAIHRSVIEWLRAGRQGVAIVNTKQAWRLLHDLDVAAADVAHGLELRKVLRPPPARIVVPEREDA